MTSLQTPNDYSIKFISFNPSTVPLSLAKTVVNLRTKEARWFIGSTNQNYCYCHHRSFLTLVLDDGSQVDSGHHLTIGFNNINLHGIRVKVHKTEYIELAGSALYERRLNECNFWFNDYMRNVRTHMCEYPATQMSNQFPNSDDLDMIETILNQLPSIPIPGGAVKWGRPRRARVQLEAVKRKRKQGGGYKNLTFESDSFLNFIYNKLISQIFQQKEDVECIELYYDEREIIGSNKTITMLIEDILGNMQKLKIDIDTVMKACYADDIEKGCYAYLNAIAASIMTTEDATEKHS
jgi:hypothetical protein